MTPLRRVDPGDWGERPHPRRRRAPWWVLLRHGAEIELGISTAAFCAAVWVGSGSVWRLVVVGIVLLGGALLGEVREMVLGQFRRIVMARRLQEAFLELGVCSRHRGWTPTVIGSAARPGMTIVRVWLPIGVVVDDLAVRRHALAEACFVDEVHVERRPDRPNTAEIILVHRRLGRRT